MQDSETRKNWNFPKIHLAKHAFQDIIEKGAVRNYSTTSVNHFVLASTPQLWTAAKACQLGPGWPLL